MSQNTDPQARMNVERLLHEEMRRVAHERRRQLSGQHSAAILRAEARRAVAEYLKERT